MLDLPPWALTSLQTGAVVLVPFLCVAIGWLVKQLQERETARSKADAAHIATLMAIQPLMRECAEVTRADTVATRELSQLVSRLNELVHEQVAISRERAGRR